MKVNFKVPGTRIPEIMKNSNIFYRCSHWNTTTVTTETYSADLLTNKSNFFISFGHVTIGTDIWIALEEPSYLGTSFYLIKESDLIKLQRPENTNLPEFLPTSILNIEGPKYRISTWKDDCSNGDRSNFTVGFNVIKKLVNGGRDKIKNYGLVTFKDEKWIQFERSDYDGNQYYMVRLADFLNETENKTKNKTVMNKFPFTISDAQAKRIIASACPKWQDKLINIWSKSICLNNNALVGYDFYKEMRLACTIPQHKLFDEIFGPEFKWKAGDWVYTIQDGANDTTNTKYKKTFIPGDVFQIVEIWKDSCGKHNIGVSKEGYCARLEQYVGHFRSASDEEIEKETRKMLLPEGTPCLVRNNDNSEWKFRIATGNGDFYGNDNKNHGFLWKEVIVINQEIPK